MHTGQYNVGDSVRRKSQPDAVGVIRHKGYLEEATGEWIYRVQFGTATRGVAETELEPLPEESNAWDDIRAGIFGSADAFRTLMTFERLRRPPSPIAASFGSAKAAFYPFQFKPLLKLLENPRQRLLIADDVGLGKTIEAGYIIRELKSRTSLERLLLVVPSRLRTKWQAEMERRFGERFDIVSGRDFIEWRKRMERNRELERFSWIVSLESARRPEIVEFLADFHPALDVVVVDEAHRMRNPQTLQHRLGKALSSCTESMILLTATPVQTGLENLFRLLNILDESEFQDSKLFEEQCEANRPVVRASAAIRQNPPDVDGAVAALEELKRNPHTRALTRSNYFSSLISRCKQASQRDRDGLVELQRDIGELSLTGRVVSRTRKVEVIPNRTLRDAKTKTFFYSDTEQAFYDSVAELCRVVRPDLSGWGQAMAAQQAFRATASCIPAAAKRFREKLAEGHAIIEGLTTEFDEDSESEVAEVWRKRGTAIQTNLEKINSTLKQLTAEDTKYEDFRETLRDIWQEDRTAGVEPRKIVLFAFFKPTLRYLEERLTADGISSRLISGDIPIPNREARIDEFANDDAIQVLLSSEVGSEGLDLQFASVVVNYDLPWNPMVVEQRIGRIDRIGQATPRIVILNLVAANTIEDRILARLYERIGIFEESVGEIDPILGETVENIAAQAIRGELSAEEEETLAEESAKALTDQRLKAEALARNTDSLMAADQSFLDEINGLVKRRKVPTEKELHTYVAGFLTSRFTGSRFPKSLIKGVAEVRTPHGVGNLVLSSCSADPEGVRFGRMLETAAVKATFDQNAALKHANAELLHARHPLVRTVTQERKRQVDSFARAFALKLKASKLVGAAQGIRGDYAFEIHVFDSKGVRPRISMIPLFVDGQRNFLDEGASEDLMLSMLDSAFSLESGVSLDTELVDRLSFELDRHRRDRSEKVRGDERRLNKVRQERRKATLTVALDHRVAEADRRLLALQERGAAAFSLTMATAKLERAKRERSSQLEALEQDADSILETELVAAGVLHIEASE